jgi:hypothetical protein
VLKAQCIKTNKYVAIKCMKSNFENIEEVHQCFNLLIYSCETHTYMHIFSVHGTWPSGCRGWVLAINLQHNCNIRWMWNIIFSLPFKSVYSFPKKSSKFDWNLYSCNNSYVHYSNLRSSNLKIESHKMTHIFI